MTRHINIKHKIQQINRKSKFCEILDDSMLDDKEKEIMKMHYLDKKSFVCIADELGYSEAGIIKKHKKILIKLESLL